MPYIAYLASLSITPPKQNTIDRKMGPPRGGLIHFRLARSLQASIMTFNISIGLLRPSTHCFVP